MSPFQLAASHLWKVGLWLHKKGIGAAAIAVVWFWLFATGLPASLRLVLVTGLAFLLQVIYSLDREWDGRRTRKIYSYPILFSRVQRLQIPVTVISVGAICALLFFRGGWIPVRHCCALVCGWLPAPGLQQFTTSIACFRPTGKKADHSLLPQFFGWG